MKCMNDAANNATNNCTYLKDLHMSLLQVSAGTLYNESAAYSACVARGCYMLNMSTSDNCTLDATVKKSLCASPVSFKGEMRLRSSGWTAVIAAAAATVREALRGDLAKALRIALDALQITDMRVLAVSRRRRQDAQEDLVVGFTAEGVSANNQAFAAALAAAAANTDWLVATVAAYRAAGGTGTFAVLGLGASTPGVTLGPGTPVPPTTTPTTGTTADPNATTTGTTTSGVALTSCVVAAVLALLLVLV